MLTTLNLKTFSIKYPVLIMSLAACFLFYKLLLQIFPGIITDQLMRDFHLTGAGLGCLVAAFYYTYMITQLFVGVLLDKYSIRYLVTCSIFCCAMGALLFSQSDTVLTAGLSRALMGIGVAFATVSYLKLASIWVSPSRYATVCGLLATAAMAGAVFGETPLLQLVDDFGWRNCLSFTAYVGIALAILFFAFVRDVPVSLAQRSRNTVVSSDVWQMLKNKKNWLLTGYSGLAFSPLAIFGGLWGNPFLQQAYHVDKAQASTMISLIFIGLALGSPLIGMLSDRMGNRIRLMLYCTVISCLSLCLVIYCNFMPFICVKALLFIFGFGLGSYMLVFTVGKESNSPALTATVIAMINMSDSVLDGTTEPLIGKMLDYFWDGSVVNGVHYFSLQNYHVALSILPFYMLAAVLILLRLMKCHPEPSPG